MADIYMHSTMARDVAETLQKEVDYPTLFLGAQSSDPMYYAVFHKYAKEYRNYADRMHDTDTQKLMIHLTEYAKTHPSIYTYSFLLGFICHYSLDVHIHPYVYHHVGIYKKQDPNTHQFQGLHLKFERSIDCVLIEEQTGKKAHKFRLTKELFPQKKAHTDVLQMMKSSFKHQFEVDHGDRIFKDSVLHMYHVIRHMATDRFGIKKQLYKIIDRFRKNHDLFMEDLSFYNHIEPYDFLNESHRMWHHPVTNEASQKSVKELYQEAVQFACSIINEVDQYLSGKKIDLKKVFTNLSFNSGLDCTASHPFQYFQCYRPKNNL